MTPRRAPRPAPRTLASAPTSVPIRLPHASGYESRFPSLAVVIASGVVIPACYDPVCGATRADELQAHGAEGVRQASSGHASNAVREIGVAIGVVRHEATTVPEPQVAGAAPPVQPIPPPPQVLPPTVPEPPMVTGGAPVMVDPTPPQPPTPPPHVRTSPNPPNTTHPPPVARPGARRPVAPAAPPPTPTLQIEGDRARTGPLPTELRTRRA